MLPLLNSLSHRNIFYSSMEFIVSTNNSSCSFHILTCWRIRPSSSEAWRWSTIGVAIWRDDYDIYPVHVCLFSFLQWSMMADFEFSNCASSFFACVYLFPGSLSYSLQCSFLHVLKHLHVETSPCFKVYILNLFYYCHDSWLSVMLDWKTSTTKR